MHAFDYVRPSTVDEAVAALGNEEAVALAGGQTLLPTMKQRLAAPSAVVDLRGIADLGGIVVQGGSVGIGCSGPAQATSRSRPPMTIRTKTVLIIKPPRLGDHDDSA